MADLIARMGPCPFDFCNPSIGLSKYLDKWADLNQMVYACIYTTKPIYIRKTKVVFGRDVGIPVDHALSIVWKANSFIVNALVHGLSVNGVQVTSCILEHGDLISIFNWSARFYCNPDPALNLSNSYYIDNEDTVCGGDDSSAYKARRISKQSSNAPYGSNGAPSQSDLHHNVDNDSFISLGSEPKNHNRKDTILQEYVYNQSPNSTSLSRWTNRTAPSSNGASAFVDRNLALPPIDRAFSAPPANATFATELARTPSQAYVSHAANQSPALSTNYPTFSADRRSSFNANAPFSPSARHAADRMHHQTSNDPQIVAHHKHIPSHAGAVVPISHYDRVQDEHVISYDRKRVAAQPSESYRATAALNNDYSSGQLYPTERYHEREAYSVNLQRGYHQSHVHPSGKFIMVPRMAPEYYPDRNDRRYLRHSMDARPQDYRPAPVFLSPQSEQLYRSSSFAEQNQLYKRVKKTHATQSFPYAKRQIGE